MNASLGLTNSQKAFRQHVLGGSDANILMQGKPEAIHRLWQEKLGLVTPENLDDILQVRMGQWTEEFNRIWFTERTGREVTCVGDERLSLDVPWMASTLDGMVDDEESVFEAKHVGAFFQEPDIIAKYQPQLHHNMIVTGRMMGCLSVFVGNHKHIYWDVPFDHEYGANLMEVERAFWHCVQTQTPPVALPEALTPAQKALDRTVTIDMSANEDWQTYAKDWLAMKPVATKFAEVEGSLKGLIDCDVKEASGSGIILSVSRNNRFSIKAVKAAKPAKKKAA